jgi:hypothetical protein
MTSPAPITNNSVWTVLLPGIEQFLDDCLDVCGRKEVHKRDSNPNRRCTNNNLRSRPMIISI